MIPLILKKKILAFPSLTSHPVHKTPPQFTWELLAHPTWKICSVWEHQPSQPLWITETHSCIHSTGNYGFSTMDQALHWAPCELLELKFLWGGAHSKDLTQSDGGD